MFNLFSRKHHDECPIDREMRLWMENSFLWLASQFGHDNIATKQILLPTTEHFPVRYDGSKESLIKTAEIVARQMELNIDKINLDIYEENIREFNGDFGHSIWTVADEESEVQLSAGMYFENEEEGKYDIFIEKRNLSDGENLVATLAHEFAHIKILGEKRLDFNDEQLTDLTTVVFGLGVFNANSAFKEQKSFDSYGHNNMGYLKQKEWGYALALFSFFRQEHDPSWIKFLSPNLKSDFAKSMKFILANPDKIFIEEF